MSGRTPGSATDPDATTSVRLGYAGCRLAVSAPAGVLAPVVAELTPFASTEPDGAAGAADAAVEVDIGPVAGAEAAALRRHGEDISIDASLYPSNTRGSRLRDGEEVSVLVYATGTVCTYSPGSAIRLRCPDPAAARLDLGRTVKNLLTSWAEVQGGLALHSSAVVVDGRAVLVSADSRNGKTSLLLELLTRTRCAMLSCDTVILRPQPSGLAALGWPSNFSVSVGTVYDYPALMPLLDARFHGLDYRQAWAIHPKEVLPIGGVLDRLDVTVVPAAPVGSVVFARFAPDAPTGFRPGTDRATVRRWLDTVALGSFDPLYPNWLGYWRVPEPELRARLDDLAGTLADTLPVGELTWAPGPLPLLRQVPALDLAQQRAAGLEPAPRPR